VRERPRPSGKVIWLYLLLGMVILGAVRILLGGEDWAVVLRTLLIYGGAFLLLMYVFGRMRRRR
jgi:hypothetical protein